jgi:hypothetical protein
MAEEGPSAVAGESWGIVGYRRFSARTIFDAALEELVAERGLPARVVSGGADGADAMAEAWAHERGIEFICHRPAAPVAAALLARNSLIVRDSTLVVAFLAPESRGTRDTINKARRAGKPYIVVEVH